MGVEIDGLGVGPDCASPMSEGDLECRWLVNLDCQFSGI